MKVTYYPDWDEAAIDDDDGNFLVSVPSSDGGIEDTLDSQLGKLGLVRSSGVTKVKNKHGDVGYQSEIISAKGRIDAVIKQVEWCQQFTYKNPLPGKFLEMILEKARGEQ